MDNSWEHSGIKRGRQRRHPLWRLGSALFFRLPGFLTGVVLGLVYASVRSIFLFGQACDFVIRREVAELSKQWNTAVTPFQKTKSVLTFLSYMLSSTIWMLGIQIMATISMFIGSVFTSTRRGWNEGLPGVLRAATPGSKSVHAKEQDILRFDYRALLMIATLFALASGITATVLFATGGFSVLGLMASLLGANLSLLTPLGIWAPAVLGSLTFITATLTGFATALIGEAGLYAGSVLIRSLGILMSGLNPLDNAVHLRGKKGIWNEILKTVKKDFGQRESKTTWYVTDLKKIFSKGLLTRNNVWNLLYSKLPRMILGYLLTLTSQSLYWLGRTAFELRVSLKNLGSSFIARARCEQSESRVKEWKNLPSRRALALLRAI